MGNIKPTGQGPQFKAAQDKPKEEVKGTASSAETRASSEAASTTSVQQNAEAFRKLLIEKFGKELGNDIADALDKLKREGKFLSFDAVKNAMQAVFERDKYKGQAQKFEKDIKYIEDLFPSSQLVFVKNPQEYDPFASAKVLAATYKAIRDATARSQDARVEEDEQHKQQKQKELTKRLFDPDKKV